MNFSFIFDSSHCHTYIREAHNKIFYYINCNFFINKTDKRTDKYTIKVQYLLLQVFWWREERAEWWHFTTNKRHHLEINPKTKLDTFKIIVMNQRKVKLFVWSSGMLWVGVWNKWSGKRGGGVAKSLWWRTNFYIVTTVLQMYKNTYRGHNISLSFSTISARIEKKSNKNIKTTVNAQILLRHKAMITKLCGYCAYYQWFLT